MFRRLGIVLIICTAATIIVPPGHIHSMSGLMNLAGITGRPVSLTGHEHADPVQHDRMAIPEGGPPATPGLAGPDPAPASRTATDDEFEGTVFNTDLWSWLNQNGSTASLNQGYLVLTSPPVNGYSLTGITQPTPAPPYQFTVKCSMPLTPDKTTVTAIGPGLYETVSSKLAVLWAENPREGLNLFSVDAQKWAGNKFAGAITGLATTPPVGMYLRIGNTGTALTFDASTDGRAYTRLGTDALSDSFTVGPDKIGIFLLNNGSAVTVAYGCEYFRRTM
jgi:hypothetical protein